MSLSKVSGGLFIHGKFTKIGYNRKVGKMTELMIYTRTLMMSTILRFPEQKNPPESGQSDYHCTAGDRFFMHIDFVEVQVVCLMCPI